MNRFKVLHVGKFYPPYKGGMETILQLLCQEQAKTLDVEVLVANTGAKTVVERDGEVLVRRVANFFHFDNAPICPRMIWEVLKSNAGILHLHYPNPMGVIACLLGSKGRPIIISYHADILRVNILFKPFMILLNLLLKKSSKIILATKEYGETSSVIPRYRNKSIVIPYGISSELFQYQSEDKIAEIRQQYGPNIILSIGRLVPYKGFVYLIRAMVQAKGNLLIIGEGSQRKELEEEIQKLELQNRVFVLGEVEDVKSYLQACEIFVLPSVTRAEAFGIVQLEAMACGKPVINTQIESGAPFVSVAGITGLTVAARDSAALAGAINQLLESKELRTAFGEAAKKGIEMEFGLQQMVQRNIQIYSKAFLK